MLVYGRTLSPNGLRSSAQPFAGVHVDLVEQGTSPHGRIAWWHGLSPEFWGGAVP